MKIASFDPSMSNWGVVIVDYDGNSFSNVKGYTFSYPKPKEKTSQNLMDLDRAKWLYKSLLEVTKGVDLIVAELPHGSQSSRAMVSYSMCNTLVGVLTTDIALVPIKAKEVKDYMGINHSKKDIINYIDSIIPDLLPKKNNKLLNRGEHIADAVVALLVAEQKGKLNESIN